MRYWVEGNFARMLREPFYDPSKSYLENFEHGPFGELADPIPFVEPGEPRHSFLGHKVFAPFGIPAGPLLNGNFVKAALDRGFDLPVYKTVRTSQYACHPWPNVLAVHPDGDLTAAMERLVGDESYSDPLSITNSFGVPSFDPAFWQPDLSDAVRHAKPGQVVIASYQGTKREGGGVEAYIEDFRVGARLLRETGVKIVEVNLSCPNEGTAALLCFDIPRAQAVVEAIREELGETQLLIKTAYFKDEVLLEKFLRAVGPSVHGVCSINTISAEIVNADGKQALPGEGRLHSGVCGRSIKWAGLEMTARLVALREKRGLKFAMVGTGGVTTVDDFDEYRRAGADAVMSATGSMWNPKLAEEVKRDAHEL